MIINSKRFNIDGINYIKLKIKDEGGNIIFKTMTIKEWDDYIKKTMLERQEDLNKRIISKCIFDVMIYYKGIKIIDLNDINKKFNMIWLENPIKYTYVRHSNFMCCSPRFIPLKRQKGKYKLIGYSKPEYVKNYLYKGIFFYLKDYDRSMINEKIVYGSDNNIETEKKENYIHSPIEAVKIVNMQSEEFFKMAKDLEIYQEEIRN